MTSNNPRIDCKYCNISYLPKAFITHLIQQHKELHFNNTFLNDMKLSLRNKLPTKYIYKDTYLCICWCCNKIYHRESLAYKHIDNKDCMDNHIININKLIDKFK